MRRVLTVLIILGAVAFQALAEVPNGLWWHDMAPSQKLLFTTAVITGSDAADILSLDNCKKTVSRYEGKTAYDLVRELDAFYQVPANIPIPVVGALVYTGLKFGGSSKQKLDEYRTRLLQQALK